MTHRITLLALMVGASVALAQNWSDHSEAFPLLPCQDGWVGCRVAGEAVSPALRSDGTGLPVPSDMRLGWWDLQPTPAFSPFVELSTYVGGAPAVAVAPEPEEPDEVGEPDPPAEPVQVADATPAGGIDEAPARPLSPRPAVQQPDASEPPQLTRPEESRPRVSQPSQPRRVTRPDADDDAVADAGRARKRVTPPPGREVSPPPGREVSPPPRQDAQKRDASPPPAAAQLTAATPPAPESIPCEVSELVKLEPQAMLGRMSRGQIDLCEEALSAAPRMTDKDKISRVLMVNAFAKGDKATWERLVKRHLDEIDQSDPELCYKYAVHLSKGGANRANGVIRWANVALENRTVWQGDTYTSRVYTLYKLRAAAAQQLWQAAEKTHANDPSDASRKKAEDFRAQTKVLAREWYEYAKVAGKDTTTALQLCMSAAGTADYCEA